MGAVEPKVEVTTSNVYPRNTKTIKKQVFSRTNEDELIFVISTHARHKFYLSVKSRKAVGYQLVDQSDLN